MKNKYTYGLKGNAGHLFLIFVAFFLFIIGCEKDNFNDIIDSESKVEYFPVPGGSGNILVSEIKSDRVTLSWDSARDESTPSTELQYMVVTSPYDNIGDADDALVNGIISMAWKNSFSTHTVTGLEPGEIHYLNILVKDRDGFISAYSKVTVLTSIPASVKTPPVPGNSGILSAWENEINFHNFNLRWVSATDTETAERNLQYMVYYCKNDNIQSYSEAQSNCKKATPGWVLDISQFRIRNLEESVEYYVNVFVRDGDGMVSAYAGTSVTTKAPAIYLFAAGQYTGNLGGRVGADKKCRVFWDSNFSLHTINHIRAFITIDENDRINEFPDNFGVPGGFPIKSVSEITIAGSWNALFKGTLKESLNSAGVIENQSSSLSIFNRHRKLYGKKRYRPRICPYAINGWWSGYYYDTGKKYTCNGFTDGTADSEGQTGDPSKKNDKWLLIEEKTTCDTEKNLLCIGW